MIFSFFSKVSATLLGVALFISSPLLAKDLLPQNKWADSFLMRSILVREMRAEMRALGESQEKHQEFLRSDRADQAMARVELALQGASPDFITFATTENFLGAAQQRERFQKMKLEKLWKISFPEDGPRKSLESIFVKSGTEVCSVTPLEIRQYLNHQKSVLRETQQSYEPELIKYVRLWKKERVYCMIMALAEQYFPEGEKSEYDYLALSLTLHRLDARYAEDVFLMKILAARYIIDNNYAESLRYLFSLQNAFQEYSEVYKLVQRQYSFVQKGAGEVSIRSL